MRISLYTNFIHWLESHMGSCFYKNIFGVDCPGCGMQRSLIELLKGNFVESFLLYPALYPLMLTFILLLLHILFRFKKGALIIKISFICTVLIMIISYIIKVTNK